MLGALGWTPQPPKGAGAVRERWESLAALVAVAEDLAATSDPPLDLPGVVAELDRRAEAQHVPSAQGVTVSTLHSAKGLEWDAVALFGIQEGSLPFVLATRPEEVAEERRLLYVGMTRAREHLHVSWSRSRGGGQATRKPSRFLDRCCPRRCAGPPTPRGQRPRKKGTVLSAHCRSCGHAAERCGRAQDRPAQRLPGDVRRAHVGAAQGVAQAAGRATRRCRPSASSPTRRWSPSPSRAPPTSSP